MSPHPLIPWHLLDPWGAFAQDGDYSRYTAERDGHKWISDRYLLIRADLMDGPEPPVFCDDGEDGTARAVNIGAAVDFEAFARLLEDTGPHDRTLQAFYVHHLAGFDLTPARDPKRTHHHRFLIRHGGEVVGAIATIRNDGPRRGRLPGDDVTREAAIAQALEGRVGGGLLKVWTTAEFAVDALDRLATEGDPS